jgi:PAS domain S-box-containing protein
MVYKFNKFKNYAKFILSDNEIFETLFNVYFQTIRNSDIPLMRFLKNLPSEQYRELSKQNLKNFLEGSLNDTALELSLIPVKQWEANDLLGIPREQIEISDLVKVTNFRKQVYVDFLNKFTQDISLFRDIVKELDEFHLLFQKHTFDTYVSIHQKALEDENEFIASLINNSIDGIIAFDKQLTIQEINQVQLNWHKKNKENVIEKHLLEVFPYFEEHGISKVIPEVFQGKKVHIAEIPFTGREGFFEANLVPWYDSRGTLKGGVIFSHDITETLEKQHTVQRSKEELAAALEELQAAEEQLREINEELESRVQIRTKELTESQFKVKQAEDQLRTITDSLPVLIAYINQNKDYVFVNKAYEKMYGKNKEDIIGRPMWETIGEKAYQKKLPMIEKALKGEFIDSEIFRDYGNSQSKWVNVTMIPHLSQGKTIGIFSLTEDISKFKAIQKALEDKNNEMRRINTDLDNFIYTASHDLKAPVSNMEGLMSLLKSSLESLNPQQTRVVEMLDTSVKKLLKTIGDLVEITKVQKELEKAVIECINFESILKEVKEDFYISIKETQTIIKEDYQVKSIFYKRSNLRSILYNLLSNAIKYRSPERRLTVEIKTLEKDGFVLLSIKDNGLGLNPNQQKKLFTLFKRMHNHVEGTGIGLFTIKRIIENNGGCIEVKSEEKKGTEFIIHLAKMDQINDSSNNNMLLEEA